jgi:predicted  nucleic acid-binding Zn-ribbon protein
MTTPELLKKLRKLTADVGSADKKHIKKLRKVLHKLKSKQHKLQEELEASTNERDARKLGQEIEVLKLQREKGVVAYKLRKKALKTPDKDTIPKGDKPASL